MPSQKTTFVGLAVEYVSVVLVSYITFPQPKREESTEAASHCRYTVLAQRERGPTRGVSSHTMSCPILLWHWFVKNEYQDRVRNCTVRKYCNKYYSWSGPFFFFKSNNSDRRNVTVLLLFAISFVTSEDLNPNRPTRTETTDDSALFGAVLPVEHMLSHDHELCYWGKPWLREGTIALLAQKPLMIPPFLVLCCL